MRKWLQILVSIAGILLALCLAHAFNICDYMTFIPKDKSYDVCITVYFALVEVITSILLSMILDWMEARKVNVEVIMFASNEAPNKASCPIIKFNKISLNDTSITSEVPSWVLSETSLDGLYSFKNCFNFSGTYSCKGIFKSLALQNVQLKLQTLVGLIISVFLPNSF